MKSQKERAMISTTSHNRDALRKKERRNEMKKLIAIALVISAFSIAPIFGQDIYGVRLENRNNYHCKLFSIACNCPSSSFRSR